MGARVIKKIAISIMTVTLALGLCTQPPASTRAATATQTLTLPDEHAPLVALTFDDGPRAETTGELLDALALREVPATFFLVGKRIEGNEDIVREMQQQGHQIGIHTYDHVMLTKLSKPEQRVQIEQVEKKLTEILGEGDYWLRPPYGIVDRSVEQTAESPLILWSVDTEDWNMPNAQSITQRTLPQVRDGDIILMHDIYHRSVDAAIVIVDELLAQGYCFVTVEQLLRLREITPENGVRYLHCPSF